MNRTDIYCKISVGATHVKFFVFDWVAPDVVPIIFQVGLPSHPLITPLVSIMDEQQI